MKRIVILILLLCICCKGFSQSSRHKYTAEEIRQWNQHLTEEGLLLYFYERASWLGTDIFIKEYPDASRGAGYFSYMGAGDSITCVFYSKATPVTAICTVSFDTTLSASKYTINKTERPLTKVESHYYDMRKVVKDTIEHGDFFTTYDRMQFNIVPIINDGLRTYVISASTEDGVLYYGNDYMITFDKGGSITKMEKLHKSLIKLDYKSHNGVKGSFHTHLPGYSPFITATDICTEMLYRDLTQSTSITVVSPKYTSTWNCEHQKLDIR